MADDDVKVEAPAKTEPPVEIDTSQIIDTVVSQVKDKVTTDVTESITKDVSDKVSEDVTDKLVERIVGKESKKDLSPWKKEDRNPRNYEEVVDWATKQSEAKMEAKLAARDKKTKDATSDANKKEADTQKKYNEYWNTQMDKLTTEGRIPEVNKDIQKKIDAKEELNEEDQKDPGVKARKDIYDLAAKHKESNLRLVYYDHYKAKKPEGASAPVLGSTRGVTPATGEEFSYEDIHNKTVSDIIAGV